MKEKDKILEEIIRNNSKYSIGHRFSISKDGGETWYIIKRVNNTSSSKAYEVKKVSAFKKSKYLKILLDESDSILYY